MIRKINNWLPPSCWAQPLLSVQVTQFLRVIRTKILVPFNSEPENRIRVFLTSSGPFHHQRRRRKRKRQSGNALNPINKATSFITNANDTDRPSLRKYPDNSPTKRPEQRSFIWMKYLAQCIFRTENANRHYLLYFFLNCMLCTKLLRSIAVTFLITIFVFSVFA